jgi:cysteine desulfurase
VHIVTTAIEHPSVLAPCELAARHGADVSVIPPRRDGIVDPEDILRAMRPDTRIVSVMAANNEIGTVQPLAEIGRIARSHGAVFHVDGAQAVAKIDVDVERDGIDFLSVSAHKLYGPKGVGALYCGPTSLPGGLPPLIHGGGQEMGRRSGTPPVAQIVGFGAAARVATERWRDDAPRIRALCAMLWTRLASEVEGVHLHGSSAAEHRIPGCLSFNVDQIDADALIAAVPQLALSSGSACSSHHGGGSHVLRALGLPRSQQRGAVRIGIGRLTTAEEIATAADLILDAIARHRARRLVA